MALTDYKPEDLTSFNGPARFRVGLARNFLLISPKFRGLNCDIVWSPLIARMVGEPAMDRPSASDQMMFNFVLVDGILLEHDLHGEGRQSRREDQPLVQARLLTVYVTARMVSHHFVRGF